ncbi:MAG: TrmB family transcriptional regulator [Candidatus Methanomethylicaceae archaeon]
MELQNKDLVQALTKFGLTEYESRVYITLLQRGTCGIKEIAAHSKVPRTKVYPVLKNLEKRQLVTLFPGKPQKAKALVPVNILADPIKDLEKDLKIMKSAIMELRKIRESSLSAEKLEERKYWITRSDEETIKRIKEILTNASKYIHLMLNHEGLEVLMDQCYDSLNSVSKSDVQVHIMIDANQEDAVLLNRFSDLIDVRYIPFSPKNNIILADGRDLIVFKRITLVDKKTKCLMAEYFTGVEACSSIEALVSGMDWCIAVDLPIMLPLIQAPQLKEYFTNARANPLGPPFFFSLMDTLSLKMGSKMISFLSEIGSKIVNSTKYSLALPHLQESLNLLGALYLLYEGIESRLTYDVEPNILTCEFSGNLPTYYKMAYERGFDIPPSIWGVYLLGLLDVFGFDAVRVDSIFNSEENHWILQYKLISKPRSREGVRLPEKSAITNLN